jgi:predicted aldo/keto reductase-like oxidoreductase
MSGSSSSPLDRREFLQAGAVATAVAASVAAGSASAPGSTSAQDAQGQPAKNKPVLATRVLGKTGAKVTILNKGTVSQPAALNQLLRVAFREGVRYFDTAQGYGNAEVTFSEWFEAEPEVRKQIFLATKSGVGKPGDLLARVDERLKRLKVDHIDLLFFHGLDSNKVDWPKSQAMKEACEAIKKTGKVSFVGFTTHDRMIAEQIQAAADGGFIDVIMLKFDPWLKKDSALNKALDAAHKANIGLVSMKQISGQWKSVTEKNVPSLKERNLTAVQGLLHAIWTDERFTSACVTMNNREQTLENVDAARRFEPLKKAELDELRAAVLAAGPTLCPNCDGRCSKAAGTNALLGDLARIYTYHEDNGIRTHARACYEELAAAERDWFGADLEAARAACHNKIDFARILPELDRLMG